jgi:membrane protease YdiL (CAAX protease family)
MEKKQFSPQAQTSLLILFIFAGLIVVSRILVSLLLSVILTPDEVENFNIDSPKVQISFIVCSQLGMFLMGFMVYLKVMKIKFKDALNFQKINVKYILYILLGFFPLIFLVNGLVMFNHWLLDFFPDSGLIEMKAEHEAKSLALFNIENASLFPIFILVSSVLPAIVEELIFRGLLFEKLKVVSAGKVNFAIWTSAAIFVAPHMQPWNIIPMIAMGAIFGYIYHYTKDIRYSMILHALFNSLSIIAMVYYPEIA